MTKAFCSRFLVQVTLALTLIFPIFQTAAATSTEKRYVVKKHDTLSEIAQRHGVTLAELLAYNRLAQPDKISEGKVLRIPMPAAKNGRSSLDLNLGKTLEKIPVTGRKWKHVVIHHSATESGTPTGMDRYHREERHMENGLAYHFVIGNGHGMADGEISIGNRWREQLDGGHLASEALNAKSIGICLVGNFDQDRPTAKQMASTEALVSYLLKRCRLAAAAVKTHQQINPIHTRCPGRNFPVASLLKGLRQKK